MSTRPRLATLFPDTRWSAVHRARGDDADASKRAIDALCSTYWKPIHGYIRYLGQSPEDAEDLTQEFFRQLMVRRNLFLLAREEKGKLRTFVCVAVKRLVADSLRDKNRLKRGGNAITTTDQIDDLFDNDHNRPDKHFDRQWVAALVERTLAELEADYVARGKTELFTELRGFITKENTERQDDVAQTLGITVGALRTNLNRMRQRYAELFRQEVAATVPLGKSADVDEEVGYLMTLF